MKRLLVTLWILLAFSGQTIPSSLNDVYWLVFRNAEYSPTYLMKINGAGQMLIQPHRILTSLRLVTRSRIAIVDSKPGTLSFSLSGPSTRYGTDNKFYFATIDPRTLQTRQIHQRIFPMFENSCYSVSHRNGANFLLVRGGGAILAAGLNSFGGWNGEYHPVSPAASESYRLNGTISDDGKDLLLETRDALLLQRLDESALPIQKPAILRKESWRYGTVAMDITNPLPNGTRVVAYWISCQAYSCRGSNTLFLRSVNANNGAPVSEPIVLHPDDGDQEAPLQLWLDPAGHFILYDVPYYKKGALVLSDVILFQALDATGRPSGDPKPIIDNVASFDAMPE